METSTFDANGAKVGSINAEVGSARVAVITGAAPVGGAVLVAISLLGDAVTSVGWHFLADLPLLDQTSFYSFLPCYGA